MSAGRRIDGAWVPPGPITQHDIEETRRNRPVVNRAFPTAAVCRLYHGIDCRLGCADELVRYRGP